MLSDFILVLSRGKTVEAGTLMKLKAKFGNGNVLKLTKKSEGDLKTPIVDVVLEKQKILDSVSKEVAEVLSGVTFEHYDSFTIILQTQGLSDEQVALVLKELSATLSEKYYLAVDSSTFDDVFKEIDKVYEDGDIQRQGQQLQQMFRKFLKYIKGTQCICI